MAFFELLKTLAQAVGNQLKPVGGYSTDGFDPDPSGFQPPISGGASSAQMHVLDSSGHLATRGPVMTDEGSFRDDFAGTTLTPALTGTLTFTNGSTTVTGVGTLFTTELTKAFYIRRSADGNSNLVRVALIVSDTELELESDYPGTTGAGAGVRSFWLPTVIGTGAVAVASSNVTFTVGTPSGDAAEIVREVDYLPLIYSLGASISQRIVNQVTTFGFESADPIYPGQRAVVVLDGTANTSIKFVTSSSAAAADTQTSTITLPGGMTTASVQQFSISLAARVATLTVNGIIVARHTDHLPYPYTVVSVVERLANTGVTASTTTLTTGEVHLSNQDAVQISNDFRADPVLVRIDEEVHYVSGSLTTTATTADQVVVSTVVPAGKTMYILGYSISPGVTGVDANPFKVGRTPVTEVVSPGAVDANVFRSGMIFDSTAGRSEDFSGNPRWIANAGQTVVVTVTPTAATSTIWRATIDYVLR